MIPKLGPISSEIETCFEQAEDNGTKKSCLSKIIPEADIKATQYLYRQANHRITPALPKSFDLLSAITFDMLKVATITFIRNYLKELIRLYLIPLLLENNYLKHKAVNLTQSVLGLIIDAAFIPFYQLYITFGYTKVLTMLINRVSGYIKGLDIAETEWRLFSNAITMLLNDEPIMLSIMKIPVACLSSYSATQFAYKTIERLPLLQKKQDDHDINIYKAIA